MGSKRPFRAKLSHGLDSSRAQATSTVPRRIPSYRRLAAIFIPLGGPKAHGTLSRKTRPRRNRINDLPETAFFITFGGPQAHGDLSRLLWRSASLSIKTSFGALHSTHPSRRRRSVLADIPRSNEGQSVEYGPLSLRIGGVADSLDSSLPTGPAETLVVWISILFALLGLACIASPSTASPFAECSTTPFKASAPYRNTSVPTTIRFIVFLNPRGGRNQDGALRSLVPSLLWSR
jgi:hypothetical protein